MKPAGSVHMASKVQFCFTQPELSDKLGDILITLCHSQD